MSANRLRKRKEKHSSTWHPHKYQLRCIWRGIKDKYLAYFLDPGLGKTTIILRLFMILKAAGLVKAVLVVAPLRPCYLVWPKEIKKWRNFRHLTVNNLHETKSFKKKADIYIINPEGLKMIKAQLKGKRKENWPFDMLVVDESTKFKNPSTVKFDYMRYIVPKMKRRYILTGTPVPNGLINIQGQMEIVDQGQTFGKFVGEFRAKYFTRIGNPIWKQFIPKDEEHEDMLYRRAARFCIRMRGKDYLELPERINNIIWVKLPPKAQKHYDNVEKNMFTVTDKGVSINAETASAVTIKCHQMANGRVYENIDPLLPKVKQKDRKIIDIHQEKLNALEDLFDELDHKPLFIAYRFAHDLDSLKKRFGKELVSLGEGVSMRECSRIEERWNKGKINLLAAYPGTSALGLNLQGAGKDVVWYSIVDDLEAYEQFIQRKQRQGATSKHVTNHLIFAENTVDVVKYKNLITKDYKQDKFLTMVEKYGKAKYL